MTVTTVTDTTPIVSRRVYKSDAAWDAAHDAVSGDAVDTTLSVGAVGGYLVYRLALVLDLSGIPGTAVISAAKLQLYLVGRSNPGGGTLTMRVLNGLPTYPHNPVVVGDYDMTRYAGNGGEHDFRADAIGGYVDFPLSPTGVGWLMPGAVNRLFLRNVEWDINDVDPGASGYYAQLGADAGGFEPKLEVTWTGGGTKHSSLCRPLHKKPLNARPLGGVY